MEYTKVKSKIANPVQLNRFLDAALPVDTGAVYTLVNGNSLKDIGIESVDGVDFYSINNQKLTRRVGVSIIEVMGRKWLTNVIFGEEGDTEGVGVTTLEQLGLEIDPVSREIKPMPMYLI